jgi:hypothetical protein
LKSENGKKKKQRTEKRKAWPLDHSPPSRPNSSPADGYRFGITRQKEVIVFVPLTVSMVDNAIGAPSRRPPFLTADKARDRHVLDLIHPLSVASQCEVIRARLKCQCRRRIPAIAGGEKMGETSPPLLKSM